MLERLSPFRAFLFTDFPPQVAEEKLAARGWKEPCVGFGSCVWVASTPSFVFVFAFVFVCFHLHLDTRLFTIGAHFGYVYVGFGPSLGGLVPR